jgi:DNA mismatch repair protein MutL
MLSPIQTLPTEVVYLIAAGEVIDSLAAVVRELVENSLDAGATRIIVSLWPQLWRVHVADNGSGMNLEDLQQAAIAHSTSKIHSCADLDRITSLGFRGEALHSLTTLAELEIFSRLQGDRLGWRVVYDENGKAVQVEPAAIAPGTVVVVANLFANCLTRRSGLPTPVQQMKAVQGIIQQIALCHPHVTYQIWQNDREWLTISSAATPGKLLPQILPQLHAGDLQELQLNLANSPITPTSPPDSKLLLVVGLPDRCHRHRPDWVKIALNGRMIKSPELEQTVFAAFHRTLPRDRYPICFLHLLVSPDQINWNRNPTKTEVYLNEMTYWQTQITQAINQALQVSETNVQESVHTSRVTKLFQAAEAKGGYRLNLQNSGEQDNLPALKAVAQVSNTYIVAEHASGIWLIEQHIAHERVLYEQLCDDWRISPVEPPIILYKLLPAQIAQLERIGLEIEPFGDQLWAVRQIPAMLQQREDCESALWELSRGGDLQTAQVAVACRSAIRNGTHLTLPEMQKLLHDWQRTRNPRTCPHGRPIYLSLAESSLARFFRRHWVIGKSHGI